MGSPRKLRPFNSGTLTWASPVFYTGDVTGASVLVDTINSFVPRHIGVVDGTLSRITWLLKASRSQEQHVELSRARVLSV